MTYMGTKQVSGGFQAIVSQMPPHDVYIETHLGSGAVLRAKPAAARSIAIEIDPATLADHPPPEGVEIINGDAHLFLAWLSRLSPKRWAELGRVLVYADPPYLMSTRRDPRRRYRHEYTDQDHRTLIALLRALPCAVMISGYPSPLYDELLGDWRRIAYQAATRGGPRTECLWMSFPAGDVQWARWAGKGFTDRQRIQRKSERWRANYRKLPPGERLAILAALLLEHSQN